VNDLRHRFTADSVGRALDLVGERWSLLILRESFFGVRRYGEFARNLSIPRPTLSARLKTLVDAGVLERVDPIPEYVLTRAGRDLFGAVVTLMQWGDRHLAGPDEPPILVRHKDCGELVDAKVACRHCGGEIAADRVTPEPGPAYVSEVDG
jgi:DNA-binding HxlR family transcriptional regulator